MLVKLPPRTPKLPVFLQRLSTEEYSAPPLTPQQHYAARKLTAQTPDLAARLSMSSADYWSGRQGTAAALRALNEAWGGEFYKVPPEAELDKAAAADALGGDQLVIDIQTHYVSDRPALKAWTQYFYHMADSVVPDRFKGLQKLVHQQNAVGYHLAEYLRCIFLESENAAAVLTAGPGAEGKDEMRNLNNSEMLGTRELIDRLAGTGRLINHANVHPNAEGEIDLMDGWKDWCNPAGWKVYTMYGSSAIGSMKWGDTSWMLDDESLGRPFLDQVRKSGVRVLSAHKGISDGSDPGWDGPSSPRDIGPVARDYPDITFITYHSGYEPRTADFEEGPYTEETAYRGVNRFVTSLKQNGIVPGSNVYAEVGTTYYQIMAHPVECAHVFGKILKAVGEDNVVWGTDCIWYGPSQPLIDTFRAFQIPEEFSQKYGYPQLTPRIKEKILGLNTARIYGIDTTKLRETSRNDDLAWVKAAMAEYSAKGTPTAG